LRCEKFSSCQRLKKTEQYGSSEPALRQLETNTGEDMPQYLVAIQHPENYQLPEDADAMIRDISALNREMIAAGVREFAGGLQPARKAKSVRKKPGGEVVVTDGPYLEAKEHVGGLWLLNCDDMDEAVEWARKAAVACRVPVEVREFLAIPGKWKANPEQGK
jgi:hypothetical protein